VERKFNGCRKGRGTKGKWDMARGKEEKRRRGEKEEMDEKKQSDVNEEAGEKEGVIKEIIGMGETSEDLNRGKEGRKEPRERERGRRRGDKQA
jgi:hypothetical protein